jgi:hypothetical protein
VRRDAGGVPHPPARDWRRGARAAVTRVPPATVSCERRLLILAGLPAILSSARLPLAAGPAAAGDPAEEEPAGAAAGDPVVLHAQRRLSVLGYAPGPRDGLLGAMTRRALREFQQDKGLRATGRLDRRTLDELSVDEPPPAPP